MKPKGREKLLRVAVIGAGNMGRNHIRVYSELEDVELVAIADTNMNAGSGLAAKYGCKYFADYRQMLAKAKPDAVSIAAPSMYHHAIGMEVLSRGIHVLMEKPIAMSVAEGEELIEAAKAAEVKLMIGHIERFNPGVIALKQVIDSGRLGKIISIIARRVGVMPPQIRDANVLVDIGVHDIDVISYLIGGQSPDRVVANGGRALLENREDYAEVFLNYGDVNGTVQVNWITPVRVRNLAITGTKGYAELDYLTQELVVHKSSYDKEVDGFGELVFRFGTPETEVVPVVKVEPLQAELSSFLASVKSGDQVVTTGEEGLEALRIALLAGEDIANR